MSDGDGVRMSRLISTVVLLIVTLVVGILFYRVMVGFFVPLFLAALLVVIFRPVHEWINLRLGKSHRLAALTTTMAILLVVLLPMVLVIGVAAAQGTSLVSRVNYNSLAFAIERTREQLGLGIDNNQPFVRIPELLTSLGEVESTDGPKDQKTARDRLREFEQVLGVLKTDFQPMTPEQSALLASTTESLDQLGVDMALLFEPIEATAPPESTATIEPYSSPTEPESVAEGESSAAEIVGASDGTGLDPPVAAEAPIDYRSPAERFQRTLVDLDTDSREFTTSLLGGPIRAPLKIWANPTEEEVSELVGQAQSYLQPRLLWVTSATGEFLIQTLIGISILTIALYFFLVDGPDMVRTLMKLSPLDDRYEHRLLLEFDRTSRAVVLATVLSALAQGALATFGYYFAGLGSIVLLFLLTTFVALIPFFGAAAVWLPCTLWLGLVEERWGAAIGLAIYGAVVVSSIDNLIKVFVLHGRSQLHPLLALLSVLGGVQVFGPIGILVGPMVVVFLQSTLEILNHELNAYQTDEPDLINAAATEGGVTAGTGAAVGAGGVAVKAAPQKRPSKRQAKKPRSQ